MHTTSVQHEEAAVCWPKTNHFVEILLKFSSRILPVPCLSIFQREGPSDSVQEIVFVSVRAGARYVTTISIGPIQCDVTI